MAGDTFQKIKDSTSRAITKISVKTSSSLEKSKIKMHIESLTKEIQKMFADIGEEVVHLVVQSDGVFGQGQVLFHIGVDAGAHHGAGCVSHGEDQLLRIRKAAGPQAEADLRDVGGVVTDALYVRDHLQGSADIGDCGLVRFGLLQYQ